MGKYQKSVSKLLGALKERAKELNCLYRVEELISHRDLAMDEVFNGVILAIPDGWQYPDKCIAKLVVEEKTFATPGFRESPQELSADIVVQGEILGKIGVYYIEEMPKLDEGPFLREERKLINTIADRLGHYLLYHRLKPVFEKGYNAGANRDGWQVILSLLQKTDSQLYIRISRKMVNHLCWRGIREAEQLLSFFNPADEDHAMSMADHNQPEQKRLPGDISEIGKKVFEIAKVYLNDNDGLALIQKWIREDKSHFLVNTLEDQGASLAETADALRRYYHLEPEGVELAESRAVGFRVSLIRRILTDQLSYVDIAKHFIKMKDFHQLFAKIIYPTESYGKLGGKSAGLLLAQKILANASRNKNLPDQIKVPKTWYLTSDCILKFIHHNNLDDVVEQKYKDIWQVRQEYPYILQVFKNSGFPPEIINGLSMALDDFDEYPLIVRSSSLLEDRMGAAFAGKYKSLFIANRGNKQQRLQDLVEAITEVYASVFGPDPIEYRVERGLIDLHEEMGVIIQEVVGQRVGDYFFPAFAGVAFSHNEMCWSRRIRREDGLIRLVPGLGTRAVDRLGDDYPLLASPGQPGIRVNISVDEKIHYSPKKIDVINLKTASFETLDFRELLKTCGDQYPEIGNIVSVLSGDFLRQKSGINIDFENDFPVVTFEGLFAQSPFFKQVKAILDELQDKLETPVDIEYAFDGKDFYLLQCRPQSYGELSEPAEIPVDVAPEKTIFSANRYVSNGKVNDISHIVYVDPSHYRSLASRSELLAVGRAVGALNRLLPRRKFILMGPGRWGSRGDVKLGVNVGYSDINNSAMLVEIARKWDDYIPEVSFGTHFFQDLLEASIKYLSLFPDDEEVIFNEEFLLGSPNLLPALLPEFKSLAETIRVIDVATASDGLALQVYMNAESEQAIAVLEESTQTEQLTRKKEQLFNARKVSEEHWQWRHGMAERIAESLQPQQHGVKAVYLFGSTKNATAGPGSDIDILIHFQGNDNDKQALSNWLKGWSDCLSEINYLRTGVTTDGLLDVHFVTDADIASQTSYAAKIGAITDAALLLTMGKPAINE